MIQDPAFIDIREEMLIEKVRRLEAENAKLTEENRELQDRIDSMCEECSYAHDLECKIREKENEIRRHQSNYHNLSRSFQDYQWDHEEELDRCQRANRKLKADCGRGW